MFNWLFSPPEPIPCPYCLHSMERTKLPKCSQSHCSQTVTETYLEFIKLARLVSVPIIGLSQVGKTTFIQALTLVLSEIAHKPGLPDTGFRACNEVTLKWYQEIRERAAIGAEAGPTVPLQEAVPLQERDVYLFKASDIPLWGSRTLALRDVAGESLRGYKFPKVQAEFCKQTKCALIAISLPDLESSHGEFIDQMLGSYVYTLRESGVRVNDGRKVVILLTKADKMHDMLPPRLWEFFLNDPVRRALDGDPIVGVDLSTDAGMQEYFKSLEAASKAISQWVGTLPQGSQLLKTASEEGIDLAFTLISAWGSDPKNKARQHIAPIRVLDPFFWLLQFHSRQI